MYLVVKAKTSQEVFEQMAPRIGEYLRITQIKVSPANHNPQEWYVSFECDPTSVKMDTCVTNETTVAKVSLNHFRLLWDTVTRLVKPGEKIQETLTPAKCHLIHMAMGVSGEAGELMDAIKRHTMYNKPLDIPNIIEELGDLLFYIQGIANGIDTTLQKVIENNKDKLDSRYHEGKYSDKQAQERADKNEQSNP